MWELEDVGSNPAFPKFLLFGNLDTQVREQHTIGALSNVGLWKGLETRSVAGNIGMRAIRLSLEWNIDGNGRKI